MSVNEQPKRLHIARLEIDLRHVAPGTARSLARALGPALARELARQPLRRTPAERIDAGRIDASAASSSQLVTDIARRIAQSLLDEEQ